MGRMEQVHLDDAFGRFDERWSPRIVAEVNDYDVKIAKVEGDYAAHRHQETDEFFLVLDGRLTLELPDEGRTVTLERGGVYTVPRGVLHQPIAATGTRILMFEPRGTFNSGDADVVGTPGQALEGAQSESAVQSESA
jgi:mannose-6-phosphate isomerase-like protein (cupin superfamily)